MGKEHSSILKIKKDFNIPMDKIFKHRCLVQMYGGLDPGLFGPYKTEKERDRAAKHHHKEMDQDDNLFALDIDVKFDIQGKIKIIPSAFTYSGGFFMESEADESQA